jgi:hypothetical protein
LPIAAGKRFKRRFFQLFGASLLSRTAKQILLPESEEGSVPIRRVAFQQAGIG